MQLFDSHAHFNDEKFSTDKEEILKEVYNSGVKRIVCAGYDLTSSENAINIANEHDYIYATVGISPNDIPSDMENNLTKYSETLDEIFEHIEKLGNCKKVVAIGEIGLDYYWNKSNKEQQKLAFEKQIEIANKLKLPIVIHTREAIFDTLDILKNKIIPIKKGIFHCCPLNLDLIQEGLKLGFYISFSGTVTFKNSKNANEAIKIVPLDKILIETDSPYLAPEPKRGTRNDSRNVKYIAEKIASVKKVSIEEIAKTTYENAKKIFEIN